MRIWGTLSSSPDTDQDIYYYHFEKIYHHTNDEHSQTYIYDFVQEHA